jgi:hypothetical protein
MSWKKTLSAIAPTLATALGGPIAGTAAKFISDKFLGGESVSETDIEQFVLNANPEQLSEIKKADHEFKLQMEKLGVDVFALEVKDKESAREHNKQSSMPAVLSVSLTVVIGLLLYALFYIEPPQGAKEPLLIVLGMVVKEWSNAMHFWFGTTRSSQDKTKLIKYN